MKKEDFFKLHIGQKVWFKGEEVEINYLDGDWNHAVNFEIGFKEMKEKEWGKVMHDLSFEPPKKKKRYWLWSIKKGDGHFKSLHYYDDDGLKTNGNRGLLDWHDLEKKKHEGEWIEIDE